MNKMKICFEAAGKEFTGPVEFAFDFVAFWGRDFAGGGAAAAMAGRGRAGDFRAGAVFDDEPARGDDAGNLGVAKAFEERENVAIDRLVPKLFARGEIS